MTNKFSKLQDKMSPEAKEKSREKATKYMDQIKRTECTCGYDPRTNERDHETGCPIHSKHKEQATVPEDLRERYGILKLWTDAGRQDISPALFEFAKEILTLIERIARLEQEIEQAKSIMAPHTASDASYPLVHLAYAIVAGGENLAKENAALKKKDCKHEWVCGLDQQQCMEDCHGELDPAHLICRKCGVNKSRSRSRNAE